QLLLQAVELPIEARGEFDGVRAGLLLNADDHRRLAAAGALATLERAALLNIGHVANQHRSAAAQRDDTLANFLRVPDAPNCLQDVLLRPLGVDTGRGVLARAADGVEQLGQRDLVGTELLRMSDDLILAFGAANRCHLRYARHR